MWRGNLRITRVQKSEEKMRVHKKGLREVKKIRKNVGLL